MGTKTNKHCNLFIALCVVLARRGLQDFTLKMFNIFMWKFFFFITATKSSYFLISYLASSVILLTTAVFLISLCWVGLENCTMTYHLKVQVQKHK